jgi:hypothetical protein
MLTPKKWIHTFALARLAEHKPRHSMRKQYSVLHQRYRGSCRVLRREIWETIGHLVGCFMENGSPPPEKLSKMWRQMFHVVHCCTQFEHITGVPAGDVIEVCAWVQGRAPVVCVLCSGHDLFLILPSLQLHIIQSYDLAATKNWNTYQNYSYVNNEGSPEMRPCRSSGR